MPNEEPKGATVAPGEEQYRRSYDLVRPELEALSEDELLPLNLEPVSAYITVLGAAPRILALRDEMVRFGASVAEIEKLETYAYALGHVHAQYEASKTPERPAGELAAELAEMHDRLMSDIAALAKRKFVDPQALGKLKGGKSFQNLVSDAMTIRSLLRASWDAIQSKTAITHDELVKFESLTAQLARTLGLQAHASKEPTELATMRLRAFTKLYSVYDEARRIVTYLRWHDGDADEIAPSLYAGRRGPKKKSESDAARAADGTTATGGASAQPGASSGSVKPPAGPGLPGSDPFTDSN